MDEKNQTNKIKMKGQLKSYMCWPLDLIALLVVMVVVAFCNNTFAGLLLAAFTVVYAVIVIIMYCRCQPRVSEEVINFAIQYASVQKRLLNELEVPYALLDNVGRIIWANAEFYELTSVDKNYKKSITALFPGITREALQKMKNEAVIHVQRKEKQIRASIRKIRFDSLNGEPSEVEVPAAEDFLTVVYLFDETELVEARKKVDEQKMVPALVYIDNYDEVLDSIEDVKSSMLVALIDRKVNQYFARMDGLVRKVEKDKYFVVFRANYLDKMKADKFHVLEDVKSIKVGNELSVTLSMGIGCGRESYTENYEMSRTAIDLALGRGGDQVVVKTGDNISYYGGKTKQVEVRTRVKARVKAQALQEIIAASDNLLVMGHTITDIDSLGSAVGVYCAARSVGKKAQIVINNPSSSIRPFIETFTAEKGYPRDMVINSAQALELVGPHTLVMVVDTNRPSYTECPQLLKECSRIVVFDHHRQGQEVVENPILSYIEPYASSACEMVAEVLQYYNSGVKLNSTEAECLYAGILIDTNNFMTKTGVRTFEAAAFLKRCGVDVTRVRKMLRNDMACYKARAEAVKDAEVYRGSYAISVCPSENLENPTIVGAQAANELLNIIGIKASFVLTEYNNKIFISSRSIDEINVQMIMEKLGGGGHLNTAGAQLTNCTMGEARRVLRATIDKMISDGEI